MKKEYDVLCFKFWKYLNVEGFENLGSNYFDSSNPVDSDEPDDSDE